MSAPRVSIIMNVRNGAEFIREALDSALAQTYTDWELIVWDDCSTDDSAKIVAEYSDDRIRYVLSPEDTPLGPARSAAIVQARGEWLAFLDQDDIWLPHKLARQIDIVDADTQGRIGMVYGRTVAFVTDWWEHDFDTAHEFRRLPEGDLFAEFFKKSCFVAISSAMFRRSALVDIGEIPAEFELISDFFLFIAIARSFEIRAVQEVVCRYRRHPNSLSRSRRRGMHDEALLLVDRWVGSLTPTVAAKARRRHQTAIALTEIVNPRATGRGMMRLLLQGSVGYVLSRPFVRLARTIRRRLGRPRSKFPDQDLAVAPLVPVNLRSHAFPLKISIIVVNWKVRDLLRDCLASVYAQMQLPKESWELIVVDNNSGDGSVEMVRREFPEAIVVANEDNVGFAAANNQVYPLCRGKFVLLLNPDVVLLDPAIDRLLDLMEARPGTAAMGCRLLNTDLTLQKWTAGAPPGLLNVLCHFLFVYSFLPRAILPRPLFLEVEPTEDCPVGWVSGACMLLRRDALSSSIFDERYFMYGEDLHLCQQLIKSGWTVVYTPRVQVVHHGGRSIDMQTPEIQLSKMSNLRRVFALGRGRAALVYFDAVIAVGFLIRSLGFGVASIVRPGRGYDIRAAKSRRFLTEAVRSLGR